MKPFNTLLSKSEFVTITDKYIQINLSFFMPITCLVSIHNKCLDDWLKTNWNMGILVYLITSICYPFIGMFFSLIFSPIIWVYRSVSKEQFIPSTHPINYIVEILSAVILITIIDFIWHRIGYDAGWLLLGILIVIHLILGSNPGANKENQSQSFGTVIGLIIYGVFLM